MDNAANRITIIIVAFNSSGTLRQCLQAVAAQNYPSFSTLVFDNASTDQTRAIAQQFENVQIITSPNNLGFAAGMNAAVKACDTDYIACLNPDAYPEPDWLHELMAAAKCAPDAAAVCSFQTRAEDTGTVDGASDCLHISGYAYRAGGGWPSGSPELNEAGYVFSASGSAALIRRDLFLSVGGYDPDFFCYWEDMDLAARLHWRGHDIYYAPKACVAHLGYATSDGPHKAFVATHSFRNQMSTMVKVLPKRLLIVTLPLYGLMTLIHIAGGALKGRGSAGHKLRGIAAGLKRLPQDLRKRRIIHANRQIPAKEFCQRLNWGLFDIFRRTPKFRQK